MSVPALAIQEMSVTRQRTLAVDRVSLAVRHGIWFGLIGANGSGKTSLLRAIAGRLPCQVASCSIDGDELARNPAERAARIGFMPPAEYMPNALTCRQVFALLQPDEAVWWQGIAQVRNALGLGQLFDRRIGDCSAGMKQRVSIGCAFATGANIVILDEPFNWLDPVAAYDLRVALRSRVDAGLTLITALHDMMTLTRACDEGLLLGGGRIVTYLDADAIESSRHNTEKFESQLIDELRIHSKFT